MYIALKNPGKFEEFRELTGKDAPVIEFLEGQKDMKDFLKRARQLVDQAVKNYQERNFTRLMVNFGCTGGRHRSVYCAEWLGEHLRSQYEIEVEVKHREQEFF